MNDRELLALGYSLDDICIALEELKIGDKESVFWSREQDSYDKAIDDVIHFIRGGYK